MSELDNELDLVKEYQFSLVKASLKALLQRDKRRINRAKRHTMHNLHRTAELNGGKA